MTGYVPIGPRKAEQLLAVNTSNRKPSEHHVKRLASDMKEGRWQRNPQPIIIGESGQLLDGQHRLSAVVLSGMTVEFILVQAPDESQAVIDRTRPRSARDALVMAGIPNATVVAAAARTLLRYQVYPGHVWSGPNEVSGVAVGNFIDEHLDLLGTLAPTAKRMTRCTPIPPTAWLAFLWLVEAESSARDALGGFLAEIEHGGGGPNTATTALFRMGKVDRWGSGQSSLMLLMKCWDYYLRDKPIAYLRVSRSELPMRPIAPVVAS